MHVKKDNITLVVQVTKKVPDIIVALTVPIKDINDHCFHSLKNHCQYGDDTHESDIAAIAYAIFEQIRDKLTGSPLEVLKTKVSNVNCYVTNGHLTITWNTAGSITSLRKTSGLALSCLGIHKLFPKYTENIKFLTGKAGNRDTFSYFINKIAKEIKSIKITAVGKINVTKDRLDAVIETISNKIPKIETSSGVKPSGSKVSIKDSNETTVLKCSGLNAGLAADYIRNNSSLVSVCITGEGIHLPVKDLSKIKKLQDKKRISDYVAKKYTKLDSVDELPEVLVYFLLSQGFIDANVADSTLKAKPTLKAIVASIVGTLKA